MTLGISCKQQHQSVVSNQQAFGVDSKRLLFLGQDLTSIQSYVNDCKPCPKPDGFTTYVNLAELTKKNSYGGLGFSTNSKPFYKDIDWGAGPINAYKLASQNPGKSVQIGLYMVGESRNITTKKRDKEIRQLAKSFKAFPETTFYLRIGYEFDGHWNSFLTSGYVEAYKYMVDYLRNRQVSNVLYVWHASASPIDDLIDGYKEDIMNYYPGDGYVDWLGISWFLPPDAGPKGSTQRELANEVAAIARAKNKPLMIAESSNQGFSNSELTRSNISIILDGDAGKNKQRVNVAEIWDTWYAPLFKWMKENGDVLKGFSYINAHWDAQPLWGSPYAQGYWGDSRIEVQDELKKRWIMEFSKEFWK